MPKIRSVAKTDLYLSLAGDASIRNEYMDCAVKTVAVACDVPYATAHATLKALGRKDRARTPLHMVLQAAQQLGVKLTRVYASEMLQRYPGRHKTIANVTTHHPQRFPEVWAQGTYIMLVSGGSHVLCVKDGQVHDWTAGRSRQCCGLWLVERA